MSTTEYVTDRRVKLGLTLVVAFCSIAYELVYSELLTVFYGGTVLRYSVTIGLYMFSLGVGAFLSPQLGDAESNFLRTEVYLALAGPLGAGVIVGVNSVPQIVFPGSETLGLVVSHVPILVVGLLSGFEIPLLERLVDDRDRGTLARIGQTPRRIATALLGLLFTVEPSDSDALSEVLGVDYLGSLAGTVVYALVLYPGYGLVVSVLALGLLNALAALTFAAWTLAGPAPRTTAGDWRAVLLVGLVVSGGYTGLVANGQSVDRVVTESYVESEIVSDYQPGRVDVDVREYRTTAYQRVTVYDREIEGEPGTDRCLRLDTAIQLCDEWVDSYHSGLVDVPMAAHQNRSQLDVLLIGGGDYVAVDHLREYGARVDQVDIDGEFLAYARNDSYLRQFHDGAYRYDRLNTTVGDATQFLRESDTRYDLILLDLPGAKSDDSLGFYSTEFYTLLRQHLTDRGVVGTWTYSKYSYAQHHAAYVNTVRTAGFEQFAPYAVYEDFDGDGDRERSETFYLLSPGPTPAVDLDRAKSPYLARNADRVGPVEWRPLPRYRGVDPNSVFHPNYDILIR